MKILLEYDEETVLLADATGNCFINYMELKGFEQEEPVDNKPTGLDYAKTGYSSEDLVKLKASGII